MLLSLFYPVLYCATFSYLDLYIVLFHCMLFLNPSINDESVSKLSCVTIHQRVIVVMLCILFLSYFLLQVRVKGRWKKERSTKKLRYWPYGQNYFLKDELKKVLYLEKIRRLNKQIFDQKNSLRLRNQTFQIVLFSVSPCKFLNSLFYMRTEKNASYCNLWCTVNTSCSH